MTGASTFDSGEIDYEGERSPGWEQQQTDQERWEYEHPEEQLYRETGFRHDPEWLCEMRRLKDYFDRISKWVKEQDNVS